MSNKNIQSILPDLIKIRRTIHQFPEVGLTEYETTKRIADFLKTHAKGGSIHGVSPTGLIVHFDSGKPGKRIMVRGDIDALPIQEINTFAHQSKINGVSHKCGHDGHTAILLGVATLLSAQPIESGKVTLVFQPAEENGKGAEAVLADPYFKTLSFDYVFALHNLPGFPLNQIVLREDNFNANVKTLIIDFKGKTAHAAEPEKGYNPSLAIAEVLQFCDQITLNKPEQSDFFLVTPAYTQIGQTAYGISPGFGTLHLTIRSWDLELFDQKIDLLQNRITAICESYHLTVDYSWTEVFYANMNNAAAVHEIRQAASQNGAEINELKVPFKWGEDFGLFTQIFKGAMFGVGAGEDSPALHNPDYDFPDDILPTAIQTFMQIIRNNTSA